MGGSLAKVNLPTAITSATYNADNQLTNWNGTTLSYDLNGNMTNDGATTYTWDARNHLAAFGSTSFSYDTLGRRTRNATGTAFLYDGVNAVQELSGSTVTANLLSGGVDEIFTRTDSAGVRNFLTDALGSTVALTDSTGTTQTQYTYEPFGKMTASGASNTSTFQYTGRENDGTGLYYYRARYYNPVLERFISEDPLDFGGGDVNLYAYAGASPTNEVDPSGQSPAVLALPLIELGPAGWIIGGAIITAPIWAPALAKAINGAIDSTKSQAGSGAGALSGRKPPKEPCWDENDRKDAEDQYPNKAGKDERHHDTPMYMGGPKNGSLTTIPAAYHQLITNAFRNKWGYGGSAPTPELLDNIMKDVYNQYPLDKCK
jgi:RHS repeat-associated protein